MSNSIGLAWFRNEPPDIRAVLAFAYVKDCDVDPVHDMACDVFGRHADNVRWLAYLLSLIERLDCGQVGAYELAALLGEPGAHIANTTRAADDLAERYRREAVGLAGRVAAAGVVAGAA
jgi:hypothetical protein